MNTIQDTIDAAAQRGLRAAARFARDEALKAGARRKDVDEQLMYDFAKLPFESKDYWRRVSCAMLGIPPELNLSFESNNQPPE
jgi:hypothetical protein